jgi:hypothetical protein
MGLWVKYLLERTLTPTAPLAKSWNPPRHGGPLSSSNSKIRVSGPSLPSYSDRVLAEEETGEQYVCGLQRKRKREDKDRASDVVGLKEIGKAGMLEEKRVEHDGDEDVRRPARRLWVWVVGIDSGKGEGFALH